jgi:hypothetical protein
LILVFAAEPMITRLSTIAVAVGAVSARAEAASRPTAAPSGPSGARSLDAAEHVPRISEAVHVMAKRNVAFRTVYLLE